MPVAQKAEHQDSPYRTVSYMVYGMASGVPVVPEVSA